MKRYRQEEEGQTFLAFFFFIIGRFVKMWVFFLYNFFYSETKQFSDMFSGQSWEYKRTVGASMQSPDQGYADLLFTGNKNSKANC